jgi:hypothetical protein
VPDTITAPKLLAVAGVIRHAEHVVFADVQGLHVDGVLVVEKQAVSASAIWVEVQAPRWGRPASGGTHRGM